MQLLTPSPGEIELAVLAVLQGGRLYGYAITKRLAAESEGVINPSPGVLYPLLRGMEKAGLISAEWEEVKADRSEPDAEGRRRKWYTLTDNGRARLEQRIEAQRAHQRMIERFMRGLTGSNEADGQGEAS